MRIETKLSATWRNRQLLLAGFLAAFGLWFVYDGAISYPNINKAFAAYEQLKAQGRESEWPEVSEQNGWRRKPPEHAYEDSQIRQQFMFAGVAFAGSLFALGLLVLNLNRKLQADDEAVYSEKGQRVPFSAITSVSRKKWDSKGIAVAYFQDNGRQRSLVIDDYKHAGGDQILKQVEERLAGTGNTPTPP